MTAFPSQLPIMDDQPFYYSRFQPARDSAVFLYVGELKGRGLAEYLTPVLARRLGCSVSCLAIVPDCLHQYPDTDLIALSPCHGQAPSLADGRLSCRTPGREFAAAVSRHPEIRRIIGQILSRQQELPLFMFESMPEMTLDEVDGVWLMGPDKELSRRLNHKGVQLDLVSRDVPTVEYQRCSDLQEALTTCERLWREWKEGIFVSRPYSAAGSASAITRCRAELERCFGGEEGELLLSRYLPHEHDPTVLAVTGESGQVFVAGIADQRIEGGNRFVGSSWPSTLPMPIQRRLLQHTRRVGELLSAEGYRGIFGCDYIVAPNDTVLFIEVNARKQGTTLEFCHALDHLMPPGFPSLMELEYLAVTGQSLPDQDGPPDPGQAPPLFWATYNHKVAQPCHTRSFLAQEMTEKELFARVARHAQESGFVILEHVGAERLVLPGTFLARAVAVGRSRSLVQQELDRARQQILTTIDTSDRK